jgi:nicotinamide mononucleotide transporter
MYVPLNATQHLGLTAVLYVGFLTMCLFGLRDWKVELRHQDAGMPFDPMATP